MKLTHYLWILPFLSFFAGYLLLQRVTNVDQLEAPALVGKQLQSVVATLSEKNLNLRFITQKEDPDLPHGTILSQTPAAGRNVKPHQAIHVVISQKPEKFAAPLLINKSITAIQKELGLQNIRNKSYPVASNKPINSCIAQFPAPGTPLEDNKIVTYLSSGNQKQLLMPDLRGRSAPEVAAFLKKQNVEMEILHSKDPKKNHMHDQDRIIANQRPLAGAFMTLSPEKPLFVQLEVK